MVAIEMVKIISITLIFSYNKYPVCLKPRSSGIYCEYTIQWWASLICGNDKWKNIKTRN